MTSEQNVKRVYPDAECVKTGGTKICWWIYTCSDPKRRRFIAGAYRDKRRAWAEAVRKIEEQRANGLVDL